MHLPYVFPDLLLLIVCDVINHLFSLEWYRIVYFTFFS
ncbi:hypothetical protein EC2749250_0306 [Escherichia coli 2749250]|nr:hypothetical protein EC2749250_0306 [Escherichia coli 2749250]